MKKSTKILIFRSIFNILCLKQFLELYIGTYTRQTVKSTLEKFNENNKIKFQLFVFNSRN